MSSAEWNRREAAADGSYPPRRLCVLASAVVPVVTVTTLALCGLGRLPPGAPVVLIALLAALHHATERQSTARLREEHARFVRLVAGSASAVLEVDPELRCRRVWAREAALLPRPEAETRGRTLAEALGVPTGPLQERIFRTFATGQGETLELSLEVPAGKRCYAVDTVLLPAAFPSKARVAVLLRDITAAKEQESRRHAADRLSSMATLAAGVAHEINNPLAFVIANLSFVAEELRHLPETGELQAALADARLGGDRVRLIVRDLRSLCRPEEGISQPEDVHTLMETAIRLAGGELGPRVRLVRAYGQVPAVRGNALRLGQVFVNLLINAAQAMKDGDGAQHELRIATTLDARGRVVTSVRDTGVGMTEETVRRLFTPFFTTRPVGAGSGLGLSFCHAIVAAHGGELWAESRPGAGSTFFVALPTAAAPDWRAATPPPAISSSPPGRVLVVDDEAPILTSVRRILGREHAITTTTSAREVVERVRRGERFDAILCDLMMPEMTGVDLHSELQKLVPDQAARLVFMTGAAFGSKARTFLRALANPCVEKPFAPGALEDHVRRLVARAGEELRPSSDFT